MAIDYSKFNKKVDIDGLKKDIKEAEENGGGEYKDVPHGKYEVKIEKCELTESKAGDPMVSIWFRIIAGEFKGSYLFLNQVVTQGFQLKIVDDFLRSLDTGLEIGFDDYIQYAQLMLDVAEECESQNLGFVVNYGERKGYNTFKIEEVFEY